MRDWEEKSGTFLKGLILGALIGGGLFYFLTSTEEGKRIKGKIRKRGENVLDNLAEIIKELEEKGEEFRKKAKEIQVDLEEKAKATQEEIAEKAKIGLSQIEKLQERGRKAAKFFTRKGKPLA